MEAEMKHYTTVEQSKKLVELGLNLDTADMLYSKKPAGKSEYSTFPSFKPEDRLEMFTKEDLPCWSLGALIDLMPKIKEYDSDGGCYPVLYKGWNTNSWHCVYRSSIYITKWHYNPLNAAFEMACWLLENGYIKKVTKEQNGKIKNTVFSPQQSTQIGIACERVQNAININNINFANMNKEKFEKVFATSAEKSGVAELARKNQFAENLQAMMIDLRNMFCPAEQQNFKVEFAGKEYEVVRVRELSNGTTMYGILDEPNHIDYINKDNCRLVKLSEDLEEAANTYANDNPGICLENDGGVFDDYDKPKHDFIAGALWQKERTMTCN